MCVCALRVCVFGQCARVSRVRLFILLASATHTKFIFLYFSNIKKKMFLYAAAICKYIKNLFPSYVQLSEASQRIHTHTYCFLIILTLAKKVWEFLNERAKSSALRIHSCRVVMLLQSGGAAHKPPVEYTTGA